VLAGSTQLAGIICAPLGGWLSDRVGRKMVILIGVAGLGPSYLLLMLIPTELILIALLAIGAVGAMRGTVTETLVTESAPPHRRATILGGYYLLVQELGGIATPVVGVLAGAIGMGGAFMASSLALAAISAGVVLFHRRL
jgi:NNP family nitrate/nitrite transporter-like MFS transporter